MAKILTANKRNWNWNTETAKQPSTQINNSLTVGIFIYDENFVPLHCQDKDGDDAPTRGKRFSHVH